MPEKLFMTVPSSAEDRSCNGCRKTNIPRVCIRVSEVDRGMCQREFHYRRDSRLKSQRGVLTVTDLSVIRQSTLLAGMEEGALLSLVNQGWVRVLYRGDSLFHQGDAARTLFLVLEGCLKEYRNRRNGVITVNRIVEAGACLGELDLFLAQPYAAGVEAVWDSRVLELPSEGFLEALTRYGSVARRTTEHLSRRLERQIQDLENAYWLSAPQRLAVFLTDLFPDGGRHRDCRLAFDKSVLAARLGMMPETLSRAFVALRGHGVRTHSRCIYIEDVEALRAFACCE